MRAALLASVLALATGACRNTSSNGPLDAAGERHDAPAVGSDGGTIGSDGGTVGSDGGTMGSDGGTVGSDGGTVGSDGGTVGSDGGTAPATQILRINEVNANATNCDLVELRAIAGGDLTGLRLLERKTLVFTFPAMTVAPDDLIVIHFGAGPNGPCSAGISANETVSPTEHLQADFPGNYDGAYDLFSTDAGLVATDNVISLMRTTTVLDAVLLSDNATGAAASASEAQAAIVAAQGEWVMVGGGVPAGGFVDDTFSANAALDLDLGGTTAAGASIQRLDNTDDNDKADWNTPTTTVQPSTWGALNVGQTPL